MAITAADVKALRERTSMGMMECKKALTETGGDTDKAIELLREWAGGKMDDRGDREATEGTIAVAQNDSAIALVFVTAESDFAAKNETFIENTQKVADMALAASGNGNITDQASDDMKALIEDLRLTIKENISLGTIYRLEGGSLGSYVHTNRKLGALIQLEGEADEDLLRGLCMHVVSAVPPVCPEPLAISADGLPQDKIDEAKAQFTEEAQATGKPAEIAEKIAGGKMKKWTDEHTLLGQTYIREMDAKKPVSAYLPEGVQIKDFIRIAVG